MLPNIFFGILETICYIIVTVIFNLTINPFLTISGVFMIGSFFFLLKIIKNIVIESKTLEMKHKSQVFSFLLTTFNGIMTMRIFKANKLFQNKFGEILTNHAVTNYNFWFCYILSSILFDYLSTICSIAAILLLIIQQNTPELTGQSLLYIIVGGNFIQKLFIYLVELNHLMSSFSRCIFFIKKAKTELINNCALNNGEDFSSKDLSLIENWPLNGNIEFKQVFLKYSKNQKVKINKFYIFSLYFL